MLDATRIREALASVSIVRRIYWFPELTSTLDWARSLVDRAGGSSDVTGTLVITNYQTSGRGRHGRHWIAPSGTSLLFTLIQQVREHITIAEQTQLQLPSMRHLAIAAPVAVRNGIEKATGLSGTIKYPNDVLINGRKTAGVLLESARDFALIGIGVNVSQTVDQLPSATHVPPTSLQLESGSAINPAQLLAAVLDELGHSIELPELAIRGMQLHCNTIGSHVNIATSHGNITGLATSIATDGALVVRNEHGIEQPVYSGDITQLNTHNRNPQ